MNITGQCRDGVLTLHFSGELDHHAARAAIHALSERIDAFLPRACVIDLGELRFMDSAGVALILRAERLMRELEGRLSVRSAPAQPRRVLMASGMGRLMED